MKILYQKNHGFTLLELLIALTILSFMIAGLYAAFSTGLTALRTCRQMDTTVHTIRNSLTILSLEMHNAAHFSNITMAGTATEIHFLTSFPMAEPKTNERIHDFTIHKVTYFFEPGIGKRGTLRKTVDPWGMQNKETSGTRAGTVIISNISDFRLSYCKQKIKAQSIKTSPFDSRGSTSAVRPSEIHTSRTPSQNDRTEEYEWVDTWDPKDGFPPGVRLQFTLAQTDQHKLGETAKAEQPITITKIIYPELGIQDTGNPK